MYRIGQFRRTQSSSYFTDLSMTLENRPVVINAEGGGTSGFTFYDRCGSLSGNNILNGQDCYYLSFSIAQREDLNQYFSLKLYNDMKTQDNEQLIDTFTVPRGSSTVYFQMIISPNATYNKIIWELERTAIDFRTFNEDGSLGRIINVQLEKYAKLIDMVPVLQQRYPELEYFTKIGVQGPPSMLMCINREQIRIGKSGVYEINNGMNITSISFFPKSSGSNGELDYFIMDFEY